MMKRGVGQACSLFSSYQAKRTSSLISCPSYFTKFEHVRYFTTTTTSWKNPLPSSLHESKKKSRDSIEDDIIFAWRKRNYNAVFKGMVALKNGDHLPTTPIMNILIDSYASIRETEKAFYTLKEMDAMSVPLSVGTLNALLKACEVAADAEEAKAIVHAFREKGIWPEIASHNHLLNIFGKAGLLEDAWDQYEAMKIMNTVSPGAILVNLLHISLDHRSADWVLKVMKELI
eukprot:TRINITY_DN6991_c0_g1_i1.p1 TRINITY_DN6991_c0_g1~~TRINITY_DN6991_c0_g1_i1.p1  ORF type:complete len:231 (-),score=57.49 TRINITY_DN6991_c0_g1_i1:19-711(-)